MGKSLKDEFVKKKKRWTLKAKNERNAGVPSTLKERKSALRKGVVHEEWRCRPFLGGENEWERREVELKTEKKVSSKNSIRAR